MFKLANEFVIIIANAISAHFVGSDGAIEIVKQSLGGLNRALDALNQDAPDMGGDTDARNYWAEMGRLIDHAHYAQQFLDQQG